KDKPRRLPVKRKNLPVMSTVTLVLPFMLTCSTGLKGTSTTHVQKSKPEKTAEKKRASWA
ncbi:MAG: hypothetical protein ACOC0W_08635, partial [Desulfosalsimonas sp.]